MFVGQKIILACSKESKLGLCTITMLRRCCLVERDWQLPFLAWRYTTQQVTVTLMHSSPSVQQADIQVPGAEWTTLMQLFNCYYSFVFFDTLKKTLMNLLVKTWRTRRSDLRLVRRCELGLEMAPKKTSRNLISVTSRKHEYALEHGKSVVRDVLYYSDNRLLSCW